MCGIAGIINYSKEDLPKLIQALHHRGPDDQTIYTHNRIALIHTRLAIQDIEHGIQPFHYENYTIIFNGEIYNHQFLRKHLNEFTFKTNSDTETLLYLYIKFKEKMFDLIDGMFAFCIYDKNTQQLFLARDRAGKKPLYYHYDEKTFIFASELNAIKAITELSINEGAIQCCLRAGFIWRPFTAYTNVQKLEPACFLTVDINTLSLQVHSYFSLLDKYQEPRQKINFNESKNLVLDAFKRSVADRLTASDVEVGVFLSGGIDSNLIAAMAAQIKPNIKTFTVKFSGLYDESHLSALTAKKYNTQHIELAINDISPDEIEKIILAYGEPFMDSSAIPSYYISRAAREHVKVILSGDGADELFAGYRRYVPFAHHFTKYVKWLVPALKFLPQSNLKQSTYNYFYRLLSMAGKQDLDLYLSSTTDIFEDAYKINATKIIHALNQFTQQVFKSQSLSNLNKMLYLDFNALLFCDLLVKMDIASMANSLEVRSPFLSKYMLDFVPTLPDHYKINRFKTKYILRKLAEDYLPAELINQPKRGFEVPLKNWVDKDLAAPIRDRLTQQTYAENFIDKKFIQNLLNNKLNVSAEKRAKMIWSLYCLEVWHKNETKNHLSR